MTTHTLSNLDIYTTYNIQVSSGTDIGFGPARNVIKRTLNDSKKYKMTKISIFVNYNYLYNSIYQSSKR